MSAFSKYRRTVHAAVFVGIGAAALLGLPFAGCSYVQIGMLRLVCPVGFMETVLASHSVPLGLVPGFVLICALVALLGRAYCSWACPASFIGVQAKRLAFRVLPKGVARPFARRWNALAERVSSKVGAEKGDAVALLVGLAIGIAIFGYPAFSIICPVGVVSRGLIEGVVHHTVRYDVILLVLPVLLALLFRNGWKCACPVGTLRGLLATPNRTLSPQVAVEECRSCTRCARVCPAGLDPEHGRIDSMMCSKCMRCADACPTGAVHLALFSARNVK